MSTNILLKKSSVAGKAPLASDLVYGELALNYTDGKLYFKDSVNEVKAFVQAPTLQNITDSGDTTTGNITVGGLQIGTYSFPSTAGSTGQVLALNSYGDLTWTTVSAGAESGFTIVSQNITSQTYVATSGQTSFSLNYDGLVEVFVNGIKLKSTDYVAVDGQHIVLNIGAQEGDVVDLLGYTNVDVVSGIATETYVNNAVANVSVDLTGYATETYVDTALLDKVDATSLATVATSGLYSDLTGTPTIPTDIAHLTDTGGLLTHFSGDYNDLTNKPSIPANTSDLTNDSGFITSSSLTGYATETYVGTAIANLVDTAPTTLDTLNELAAALGDDPNFATSIATAIGAKADSSSLSLVATSGDYNDLINKPTLFSGSYNDLTNKPTIPSATSDLTNDSGFITTSALTGYATESYVTTAISGKVDSSSLATVATTGDYGDLINTPTIPTLTLEQVDVNGTATESYSNITILQFDEDSGFDVTNPSAGVAKVAMNSTFKYWEIDGVSALTAVGLDTVNFVSGPGITMSANNGSDPKTFTISTDIKTINGNSIIGSGDLVVTPPEQSIDTTTTSAELMDSFATIDYRSAEYFVTTSSTDGFSAFKVLIVHDDTNAYYTTYAVVGNTSSGDISVSIASNTVNVYFTATNASTQVKFIRTTISGAAIAQMPSSLSTGSGTIDLASDYGTLDLNGQ